MRHLWSCRQSWSRVSKQDTSRMTDTGSQRLRMQLLVVMVGVVMMMMRIRTTRADGSRCGLLAHWECPPVFSCNGLWRSLVVCTWHLVTTSQPALLAPLAASAAASSHHRRHVYATPTNRLMTHLRRLSNVFRHSSPREENALETSLTQQPPIRSSI